ncbi:MAG: LptF/LptG family permease [Spirochaetota bacterium]
MGDSVLQVSSSMASKHRNYFLIYRYIAKEFIFSLFVAFLFFFFIFFLNQLLLLAEDILSKRVPFFDVLLLIVYSMPLIASLAFPFASLVGALMTVGRLSADNEILAFQASGIPNKKIFSALLFIGLCFSLFSFIMNDYFLPRGTINFGRLYRKMIYSNPEIELEAYSVKRYQDSIIITGAISRNTINNLLIIDKSPEQNKRVITAKNATLSESEEQQGVISLDLDTVFGHTADSKKSRQFEYFNSRKMIYNILLKDISLSIQNPGPGEMSSRDVYKSMIIKEKNLEGKKREIEAQAKIERYRLNQEYYSVFENNYSSEPSYKNFIVQLNGFFDKYLLAVNKKASDRSLQIYKLEFNRKFAVPFACLIFIFFAFPVGLFTKRSGRSVGFGIGLFMSIVYWGLLLAGQTFGLRMDFPPSISMWLPNIVILLLGLTAFLIRAGR